MNMFRAIWTSFSQTERIKQTNRILSTMAEHQLSSLIGNEDHDQELFTPPEYEIWSLWPSGSVLVPPITIRAKCSADEDRLL